MSAMLLVIVKKFEKYDVGVYSTDITITPDFMKMRQRQHDGDFLTKAKEG
jgi:hypothetical protein